MPELTLLPVQSLPYVARKQVQCLIKPDTQPSTDWHAATDARQSGEIHARKPAAPLLFPLRGGIVIVVPSSMLDSGQIGMRKRVVLCLYTTCRPRATDCAGIYY
jgi:hypothetical protein